MPEQLNQDQIDAQLKQNQIDSSAADDQLSQEDKNLLEQTFKGGTKELLKGYKEIQGAYTKMTQKNKELEQQLTDAQKERELLAPGPSFVDTTPTTDDYDPNADTRKVSAETYSTMRIAEVLEEEHLSDKESFNERYAYVNMLSRQYPHFAKSAPGVKKLFKLADEQREKGRQNTVRKSLDLILGREATDEDIERLRKQFGGVDPTNPVSPVDPTKPTQPTNLNAYMPDATSTSRTGAEQGDKPNFDAEIEKAKAEGNTTRVIELTFQKALAE